MQKRKPSAMNKTILRGCTAGVCARAGESNAVCARAISSMAAATRTDRRIGRLRGNSENWVVVPRPDDRLVTSRCGQVEAYLHNTIPEYKGRPERGRPIFAQRYRATTSAQQRGGRAELRAANRRP